jgi:hypothetical protein
MSVRNYIIWYLGLSEHINLEPLQRTGIPIIPLTKKEVNQHWSYPDRSILDLISRIHSKKGKKLTTAQTPQNQELDAQLKGELIIFPTACNKILVKGIVHRFHEILYITTDHADDGDVYYFFFYELVTFTTLNQSILPK